MHYFAYSPLDMSADQAYQRALPHLMDNHIVHITQHSIRILPPVSGERPRALPGTYLVRVDQDQSLRVVDRALE